MSFGLCYSTISPQYSTKDVVAGTHKTNNIVVYVEFIFQKKNAISGENGKRQENITGSG